MRILFIRHGLTQWNIEKKLQGQTDIALCDQGMAQVSGWRIKNPPQHWYVSPLLRTQQTAQQLKLAHYITCDALTEMSWGRWEGKTLKQLRREDPKYMRELEALGLDLKAPGGESPRQVRERLKRWLATLTGIEEIGLITHKGVIRAALSLASNWDMKSDHPVSIRRDFGYLFEWNNRRLDYMDSVSLLS